MPAVRDDGVTVRFTYLNDLVHEAAQLPEGEGFSITYCYLPFVLEALERVSPAHHAVTTREVPNCLSCLARPYR